jgi:hypothetical protein
MRGSKAQTPNSSVACNDEVDDELSFINRIGFSHLAIVCLHSAVSNEERDDDVYDEPEPNYK